MLLMNSTDLTFMVSTTKPQRLPSLEHDYIHETLRSPPISMNLSSSLNNASHHMSGSISISPAKPKISPNDLTRCIVPYTAIEQDVKAKDGDNRDSMFEVQVTVDCTGNAGGDDHGGRIYGGGGNDADYHENDGADVYYQRMIQANPKNSLILGNYAKYLKEVRGDFTKAMEYCSRSILVDSSDGSVLAMYADLIWATQNDAVRAESYFEQAVKASPDDWWDDEHMHVLY